MVFGKYLKMMMLFNIYQYIGKNKIYNKD